jgi:hypothetical protein
MKRSVQLGLDGKGYAVMDHGCRDGAGTQNERREMLEPRGLFLALLGVMSVTVLPGRADAQQVSCSQAFDVYACASQPGTLTSSVSITAPGYYGSPSLTEVLNRAAITYTAPSWTNAALGVSASGVAPWGVQITNAGAITLSPGQSSINDYVFGIWANEVATNGSGTANGIGIQNDAPITLQLSNVTAIGGAAIWATDRGGDGSGGGTPYGVVINNTGAIQASLSGTSGFAGIQAIAIGGNGTSSPGGGGDSGVATVNSTGSVAVDWTWQNAGSTNNGVWGIQAYSQGGNGLNTNTSSSGNNGGSGGGGGTATVNIQDGNITVNVQGTPPSTASAVPSAAVAAISVGGAGGYAQQGNGNSGTFGGSSGNLQITDTDASVTATGDNLPGLLIYGASGTGGYGGSPSTQTGALNPSQDGGSGGWVNGGGITVTAQSTPVTISTASSGVGLSPAVSAVLVGGAGGYGGYSQDSAFSTSHGGDAGNGASVGTINIQVQGSNGNTVTLATTGLSSPGIYASSLGGAGGYGGGAMTAIGGSARGGNGGGGGWGGNINVSLASTIIQTQNNQSPGIIARSEGGIGGTGGYGSAGTGTANGGNGGNGGTSGNVYIQTDSASSITTQGADSMGILAQSLSAAGGDGNGNNASLGGSSGNAGVGGNAGSITVNNGATIATSGPTARGILVQSMAGSGGNGGSSWSIAHAGGGTGAAGGTAGALSITNSGAIATTGANAEGILLQSIGGGGGAGGQSSGVLANVGGSGGTGSDGGTINLSNSGAISTGGMGAIGVLGQSIGGSGGDGGGASGITVTVGGTGGSAAAGGAIAASLNSGSNITTTGAGAHGVIFQSIGGGGGNGGDANSTGTFVSVAVGGSGGDGGAGGQVTVNTNGANISAAGNKSTGLIAQSIGGGGGTGGSALGTSIGAVFDASVSVGGTGGNAASAGGQASVTMAGGSIATGQNPGLIQGSTAPGSCLGQSGSNGACNVLPVDSHGVVVQSIGGGGGHGGQATAQAIAIATPVTPDGSQLAISAAVAVGGKGGAGGDGGTAQFSQSSGGTITTSGNGGVGALVQSVGGGGGDGGDSSAMAASIGYGSNSVPEGGKAPGITMTATVAGTGGKPGGGGTVQVAVGGTVSADGTTFTCDCDGTSTSIQTYGDYAPGILAQSIGGGGGNAGQGAGNTQNFGTGSSSSLSFNVGRGGSPGGNGGNVTVNLYPGAGIQTWGSAAVGIIAQSIGGGGGTSEGGSFSLGQSFEPSTGPTQKPGMNVNMGNQASEMGGTGQAVTVSVQAPIVTHGNDATGVLAQSIGGGGGLGGSSGSDGSGDNPVLKALEGREFESNVINYLNSGSWSTQQNTTMNISIGGTGGAGGGAGPVSVTLASQIATLGNPVTAGGNQQASSGDWAHGIVAQSIGGGGGKGGSAMSSGSGADPAEHNVFYNLGVGGTGGSGGAGGQVNVNFSDGAAIQTVGYAATGVVAQSIGGGGGMGADGSDAAGGNISVGGGLGGSGGSGGAAGNVDFENSASNGGSISTAGTFADGMNLQSIGGGGGIAGAGASVWASLGAPRVSSTMTFTAGGGTAASGAGGNVTVNQNFANNVPLNINVSGYGAYGIVAQSIGGGGGNLIANQAGSGSPTVKIGGLSSDASATGGSVTVNLTTPSVINANGTAGIGVVAQSVGNGGGIIRINDGNNTTPSLTTGYNPAFVNQSSPGPANGGSVLVTSYATINANGPGGIGIFAQSVGGGGGLILNGSTLYAGAPLQQEKNCTTSSCGGISASGANNFEVSIQGGSVSATGTNGIGIFAQAAGYGTPGGGTPDVVVGNTYNPVTVTGGSGSGAGIWIDRPNGNSNDNDSWVTINGTGVVTTSAGSNGTAIQVTGGGIIALANYGSITGALDLNAEEQVGGNWTPGALTSRGALQNSRGSLLNYGTWVPGALARADILNPGTIQFDNPAMTTRVNGHFIQTSSGRLSPMIDSLNGNASLLKIDGSASVDGTIVPNAVTLLPGTVTVLTAGSLGSTAQAQDSLLFDWEARTSGNAINITPNPNFTPSGVSLNGSQSSQANYYNRGWNNADATLAGLFGGLSHINDGGTYKKTLDSLSSKATQAQSMAVIESAGSILGAGMSCPVFVGDGVQLGEDNCVWGQVNGRWTDQSTTSDTTGYHVSGTTYRIGVQHQVAPDWYVGGSLAAGQTWASTKGGSSGDGDTYDGSVTVKHLVGPWYFAGSLAMASGSFNNNRQVNFLGNSQSMSSDSNIFLAGARLRAGYEFNRGDSYIRPYTDLDVVYTHAPGFKESGASPYALDVRTSDQTNFALSPMIEFGQRHDVDAKTTLRTYVALGLSWRPDNTRTVRSSFVGADPANGTFTDYIKSPEVLAKVDLGIQMFRAGGFEVRAGYTADIGHSFLSQSASARFAYHF